MKQFRIDEFENYAINVRKQVFKVKGDGSTKPLSLRSDGRYLLRDAFGNEKLRTPNSLYWSTMDVVRHSIPGIKDVGSPFSKYMIDKDFNVYSKKSGLLKCVQDTVCVTKDSNSNDVFYVNRMSLSKQSK